MSLTDEEWRAVEGRAVRAVAELGIPIETVGAPYRLKPKTYEDLLRQVLDGPPRPLPAHVRPYLHLEFRVPYSPATYPQKQIRVRATEAIRTELGPEFVVDFHSHPQAYPQDVIYVFPAAHAWPEECFRICNVTLQPKSR